MASGYFAEWLKKVDSGIKLAAFALDEGEHKDAAFLLHQSTERAYICFLLVRTLYFPRSHNIKFLRSLAEDNDPRLIEAWRSEEHTSELQSLMRISYAVFCLKKKKI